MPVSMSLLQQIENLVPPAYPSITGLQEPISGKSLMLFFYALGWAWVVLVSFAGWGRFTGNLFGIRRLPASIACTVGIAVTIFVGGLLNLVQAIYLAAIFVLVFIGLLLYFLNRESRPEEHRWWNFWEHSSPTARLLLIATVIILFLRVAGTVRLGIANGLDDGPAYLALPHKMMQSHGFAPDPFSERRVTTSLGGGYFLQLFIVSATSLSNVAMADRTLGLVLLAGVLFDLGILFELSASQIALMELLAYLVPQEAMNLTFVIFPVSVLLGMAWMIWRSLNMKGWESIKYAFLAGALGGAIISLKSTYLPYVGAYVLVPYVLVFGWKKPRQLLNLVIAAGVGALTVLFAWMVAMKVTSGTYLFPILGHGTDYSSYHLFRSTQKFGSERRFVKIFLQGIALLVLAVVQLLSRKSSGTNEVFAEDQQSARLFSSGILIAAAAAITAMNYASGGDSIWRYNFPQFFSAVLIYYVVAASILEKSAESGTGSRVTGASFAIGVVSLFAMMFYYDAAGKNPTPFRELRMAWGDYLPSVRASLSGRQLENYQVKAEYRSVEDSLPLHAVALENTAYPFLFNYRDRRILIADWPGAASPAPGWPFYSHEVSIAEYLKSQSIHYVVYDYGYARWTDLEGCRALEGGNLNSEWLKQQWWLAILTHHQFDRLRARYQSVYDDKNIAVIDLYRPIANAPAVAVWTLDTNKDEMCSAVAARYFADPLPSQQ